MNDVKSRVLSLVNGVKLEDSAVEADEIVETKIGPLPVQPDLPPLRSASKEELQEQRASAFEHGALRGERQAVAELPSLAQTTIDRTLAIIALYEAEKLGLTVQAYEHILALEGRIAKLEARLK